jgi:hypothetical protein
VKLATFDTAKLLPFGSQPQRHAGNIKAETHHHGDGPQPPPQGALSPYLVLRGLPNSRAAVRCVSGGVGPQGAPLWSAQSAASFHPRHRACAAAWRHVWRRRTNTSSEGGGPVDHVLSFCDWTWFHRSPAAADDSSTSSTSSSGRSLCLGNRSNDNNLDEDENNATNGGSGEWRSASGGLAGALASSSSLMSLSASLSSSSLMSLEDSPDEGASPSDDEEVE